MQKISVTFAIFLSLFLFSFSSYAEEDTKVVVVDDPRLIECLAEEESIPCLVYQKGLERRSDPKMSGQSYFDWNKEAIYDKYSIYKVESTPSGFVGGEEYPRKLVITAYRTNINFRTPQDPPTANDFLLDKLKLYGNEEPKVFYIEEFIDVDADGVLDIYRSQFDRQGKLRFLEDGERVGASRVVIDDGEVKIFVWFPDRILDSYNDYVGINLPEELAESLRSRSQENYKDTLERIAELLGVKTERK